MNVPVDPGAMVGLRRQLGLTQRELARSLDVTEDTVANWERGRARAMRRSTCNELERLVVRRWAA